MFTADAYHIHRMCGTAYRTAHPPLGGAVRCPRLDPEGRGEEGGLLVRRAHGHSWICW